MLNDFRLAARTLGRNPGFTLVAVLTLALGIGANTALFSVADAVLLKPLPYAEPDRIIGVANAGFGLSKAEGISVSSGVSKSAAIEAAGIYFTGGMNAGGDPGSERIRVAGVSTGFFPALGAQPIVGRVFTAQDVATNKQVAVISHDMWRTRLGGDPNLSDKTVLLNGRPFVVLGVLPPRFTFPDYSQAWVPTDSDPQIAGMAFAPDTVARLKPGVTLLQARDDIDRTFEARRQGRPRDPREEAIVVTSLRNELVGSVRPLLLLVAGAVFLVLLVACINTANLMLARLTTREREIAVRRALGASSGRLLRFLLCESALVAALAGLAAIPAALWTLNVIRALLPVTLHGVPDIAIDARAAVVTGVLCVIATLLFGLAPALSIRRGSASTALRGVGATAEPFWRRFRTVLVIAEVAAAVVLLAGAVTIVRTVSSLLSVDLGARGDRAVTMQLTLPRVQYPTAVHASAFYDRLHAELGRIGIEAAGAASTMPGTREMGIGVDIKIEGLPAPQGDAGVSLMKATPGYFAALGIDVIAGRPFEDTDRAEAPDVAIVSERVATVMGLSPPELLGRRIDVWEERKPRPATIVGVVRDVRLRGPELASSPQLYVPFAQSDLRSNVYIAVKARGDARSIIEPVRAAVLAVDANLPAYNVRTFDEIRQSYVADRRFAMVLMALFAGLTAALSAIGLYGVISYLTQLRTREIGIRVALGATPGGVLRQTMRGGLVTAAVGVAIGTAAAAGLSRLFISRVPGLQQTDVLTLSITAAAMLILAACTITVPARRASRVNPVEALRAEG